METIVVMYLIEKDSAAQENEADEKQSLSEDCVYMFLIWKDKMVSLWSSMPVNIFLVVMMPVCCYILNSLTQTHVKWLCYFEGVLTIFHV